MSIATTDRTNGQLQEAPRQRLVATDNSAFSNLLDTAKFEHMWRIANAFAASDLVPAQFQRKPENCFIGVQMAIRLNVDPFMFLQSCYVVHGRPGIEAKLAIALANSSGVFIGPIRYKLEGSGKSRKCTAFARVRETDETIEMSVDWAMVEAEGWNKKSGSKWLTIPEVMFRYRAAMLLIRTHCPEVIMGMQSKEELDDATPAQVAIVERVTSGRRSLEDLTRRFDGEMEENTERVEVTSDEAEPEEIDLLEGVQASYEIATTEAEIDAIHEDVRNRGLNGEQIDLAETWRVQAYERVCGGGKKKQGKLTE